MCILKVKQFDSIRDVFDSDGVKVYSMKIFQIQSLLLIASYVSKTSLVLLGSVKTEKTKK